MYFYQVNSAASRTFQTGSLERHYRMWRMENEGAEPKVSKLLI